MRRSAGRDHQMLPDSCRAAALVERGKPLQIIDVPIPEKLEDGALLVRTDSATLCSSDVHVWKGETAAGRAGERLPLILGHEMTGRIVRFGDGPRTDSLGQSIAEGDRVVWTHGTCGRCRYCVIDQMPWLCRDRRRYTNDPCTEYPYLTGGFAEYCYVFPTSGRVRVPDAITSEVAAASSCSLRTVIHGFDRLGPIDETHTVVIQGTGPLGLFATARATTAGAGQIITVGGPERRLALASQWGADVTLDIAAMTDQTERVVAVMEMTHGRGADVVIEVSGIPAAFTEGIDMLRPGGRYLILGQVHGETVPFNPSALVFKHARLIGCLSAGVDHYWRALEFLTRYEDRFSWGDMMSTRYPLSEINVAFDNMASWRDIKPAISFG